MAKRTQGDTTQKETAGGGFLGFTRHDLALGTAGFVGGIDAVFGALVPGRVVHPLVEGEIISRNTYAFLEKNLPGGKKNKER